jgi:hypothetical protein
MKRFTSFLRYALLTAGLVATGLGFNACSDDPAAPSDPPGSSLVTFIQANPGFTSSVVFKLDTATLAGPTPYGTVTNGSVRNGNKKIDVRATDGAVLGTTNVQLDSTMRAWVIFSGNSVDHDVFSVSTKRKTAGAGEAFVRVINASKNVGDVIIKLNSATGLSLTQSKLSYKGVNDYVSLAPSAATQLVVLKDDGVTPVLNIPVSFVDQASYTVIIYGSADPAAQPDSKLNAKIVSE